MKKIIDLSHGIFDKMPVFPGDPEVEFQNHCNHENSGYFVTKFSMGTHSGTHLDVPLHKIKNGTSVDRISLDKFIGKAAVLDFTFLEYGTHIGLEQIKRFQSEISRCDIVLFKTGWSKHFGQKDFFDGYSGIELEAAIWLCGQGIKMIGLESPSVHPVKGVEVHQCLLEKGIIIVETLCNLGQITQKFVEFFAVPLNLSGLDGSPVRAFAIEE